MARARRSLACGCDGSLLRGAFGLLTDLQPTSDDGGVLRPELGDDRQQLGTGEPRRMLEDRLGYFEDVAREPAHHRGRSLRIICKFRSDGSSRPPLDAADEPSPHLSASTPLCGRLGRVLAV